MEILADTRRRLYGLLAEGPDAAEEERDGLDLTTVSRQATRARISDADRDDAIARLGEHYAAGRLDKEEFDERSDAVWTARTDGDLAPVFADLVPPRRGDRGGPGGPAPYGAGWFPLPFAAGAGRAGRAHRAHPRPVRAAGVRGLGPVRGPASTGLPRW